MLRVPGARGPRLDGQTFLAASSSMVTTSAGSSGVLAGCGASAASEIASSGAEPPVSLPVSPDASVGVVRTGAEGGGLGT